MTTPSSEPYPILLTEIPHSKALDNGFIKGLDDGLYLMVPDDKDSAASSEGLVFVVNGLGTYMYSVGMVKFFRKSAAPSPKEPEPIAVSVEHDSSKFTTQDMAKILAVALHAEAAVKVAER